VTHREPGQPQGRKEGDSPGRATMLCPAPPRPPAPNGWRFLD
jgi:hypothetical protein